MLLVLAPELPYNLHHRSFNHVPLSTEAKQGLFKRLIALEES
jgi:hypothetical protein